MPRAPGKEEGDGKVRRGERPGVLNLNIGHDEKKNRLEKDCAESGCRLPRLGPVWEKKCLEFRRVKGA